ncbi:uncharacterized protein LOC127804662 [Diospyros lotus]|uniref:uncharacterized protein LOC127804662 n=1 Tax=Diospyros lotus TaxID=55363 RepID=UPI00224ECB62|nr:uncharacterized protein LOC127804662 [Diospyros lotus]XP_052197531.1 uncharacterized protein LOC127804662 [Diospyros lotus]XP_052197532.1 uncharacterized protein LOC127804662 [Diospyros lotus]
MEHEGSEMDYTFDDDSCEMITWGEFCVTDSDDGSFSRESEPHRDGVECTESSDMENDGGLDVGNEMECSDGGSSLSEKVNWEKLRLTDSDGEDSSEKVDWEKLCLTDSDREGSSSENKPLKNGKEERFQVRSPTYQKQRSDVFRMPMHIKRKEDLEVKDVVKEHALPFLPAKSLMRFKAVSKDWDSWISSPFLAHKQSYLFQDVSGFFCQLDNSDPIFMALDQSAYGVPSPHLGFLPESVLIRSSCNGLLLCQGCFGENVYYICNPATKEWKMLPQPSFYHGSAPAIVLAFEPSVLNIAAHFEVICAFTLMDVPLVCFEIYSSETKSWRCPAENVVELGNSALKGGFYMNRVTYWETTSGNILAFDMKNEVCGTLPLPPGSNAVEGVLTQMRGELCYIQAQYQNRGIYSIGIHGGMDMSLKQSIVLGLEHPDMVTRTCRVLPCVDSDTLMILVGSVVYSYNVRDQKAKVVSREGHFRARYLPYVNSLVSVAPE